MKMEICYFSAKLFASKKRYFLLNQNCLFLDNILNELTPFYKMEIPESVTKKRWHVIYTRSRAEKRVDEELTKEGIECFLPLQKKLRQWKDRKKWVEMPLIPGYCFVNISRKEYDKVLQTNNVVGYIFFEKKAAIIPDEQIQALKKMITQFDVEVNVSNSNFVKGKKIEIISGPLLGLTGELREVRGKNRFMVRIVQINTTFSVELSADKLSYVPSSQKEKRKI